MTFKVAIRLPAKTGTPPHPCSNADPFKLDYSQKLFKKGTQTSQQHILENHTVGGKGPSFYAGDWLAIKIFNASTVTDGNLAPPQFQRPGTYTLRWDAPPLPWPLNLIWPGSKIGWGQTGQPTSTNQLVVKTDCSTVITSYPVNP